MHSRIDQKIRVLIVDDEQIVVSRLTAALAKSGCIVEGFTSSDLALEALGARDFDIIITDLKMPGIDGMAIVDSARARLPHARIIMISGFATIETVREALKVGVYDFVVKPFRISQLKELVEKAFREPVREDLQSD